MAKIVQSVTDIRKSGGVWKVVVAVPGVGARGQKFSKEILQSQGPVAFPPKTKAFIGHKRAEERDPLTQFGSYPKGAWFDEDFDRVNYPDGALVAELKIHSRFKDAIDDLGEDGAELSIYADGDTDSEGNVISMEPARDNSIDLVAFGGLEGSRLVEKISESLISEPDKTRDHSAQVTEKDKMELEKIMEALTALTKTVDSLVAAKSAQDDADAKTAVDAEVEAKLAEKVDEVLDQYEADVKAIEDAELLPSLAESLRADARKGKLEQSAIDQAKKITAEGKSLSQNYEGFSVRVGEAAASESMDFTIVGIQEIA